MSEYNIQMNKYNASNAGYDQLYPQPMKHANTHAKDGNDPITPSMIGTYNKTEIDTALQNKAPSGYGFGEVAKYFIYTNDPDGSAFEAGIQPFIASMDNAKRYLISFQSYPFVNSVSCHGYIVRTGTRVTIRGVNYDGNVIQRIWDDNTGWFPWEWENPPMLVGVEYRTTERYLGKPVYVKVVDIGNLPNNDQKGVSHGVSNIDKFVSVYGRRYSTDTGETNIPFEIYNAKCGVYANINNIFVYCNTNASSSTGYVTLKYTKTTD